jgi:hypothetical protein
LTAGQRGSGCKEVRQGSRDLVIRLGSFLELLFEDPVDVSAPPPRCPLVYDGSLATCITSVPGGMSGDTTLINSPVAV